MDLILTAFASSPDRGQGLARDMPVRWALEELGLPYQVRTVTLASVKDPEHRSRNPFGQIPALEVIRPGAEPLVLSESGAIVLYLARGHPGLLPADPDQAARSESRVFAALSTVEPPVVERSMCALFETGRPWHAERLAVLDARVRTRLDELALHIGTGEWLDGAFCVGDLMMIAVLRRLASSGLLDAVPEVAAYVARGEARPAFRRAFEAQRALFEATSS